MQSHAPSSSKRRSRSPKRHSDSRREQKRSRSPHSHRRHHHHSSSHKHAAQIRLPLQAEPLRKNDFKTYEPMFTLYLDIQKQIELEDLEEEEVRGRWKSFVGKWNRGELAEGWYDPATLQKAQRKAAASVEPSVPTSNPNPPTRRPSPTYNKKADTDDSSEDDIVGPTLPGKKAIPQGHRKKPGPAIPNTQDVELKRELEQEGHDASYSDLRHDRKIDRKVQKERLDELVPRAEAGSKDRVLEKKREKANSNRAFASAKTEAGGVEDVPESDLLGDDGGIEGFKKVKKQEERKKNERELRKEEMLRARREERDERVREYQDKEERTMSGLVALARARFG